MAKPKPLREPAAVQKEMMLMQMDGEMMLDAYAVCMR
jgi:hypothetical protein